MACFQPRFTTTGFSNRHFSLGLVVPHVWQAVVGWVVYGEGSMRDMPETSAAAEPPDEFWTTWPAFSLSAVILYRKNEAEFFWALEGKCGC